MNMTGNDLKKFRKDFESLMESLEKKYSVKIDLGRILFSNDEFSGQLKVVNSDNSSESAQEILWRKEFEKAGKYDFTDKNAPKNPVGNMLLFQNKPYIFKGINKSSKKYAYILEDSKNPGHYIGIDYYTFINSKWL